MADQAEWMLARRIASLVANEPGRGMRRAEVMRRLMLAERDFRPAAMLAYARGWIDFVRDWVVAPERKSLRLAVEYPGACRVVRVHGQHPAARYPPHPRPHARRDQRVNPPLRSILGGVHFPPGLRVFHRNRLLWITCGYSRGYNLSYFYTP